MAAMIAVLLLLGLLAVQEGEKDVTRVTVRAEISASAGPARRRRRRV